MSIALGYKGGESKLSSDLLEVCRFWDRNPTAELSEFLPRLKWERASGPCCRGMGFIPVWHLCLDWKDIGWIQCYRKDLPTIENFRHFSYLPVGCEWIEGNTSNL